MLQTYCGIEICMPSLLLLVVVEIAESRLYLGGFEVLTKTRYINPLLLRRIAKCTGDRFKLHYTDLLEVWLRNVLVITYLSETYQWHHWHVTLFMHELNIHEIIIRTDLREICRRHDVLDESRTNPYNGDWVVKKMINLFAFAATGDSIIVTVWKLPRSEITWLYYKRLCWLLPRQLQSVGKSI